MTIFHKIVRKEIPAHILYEDEDVLLILDIFPMTYGHSLVIPKKFSANFLEMDAETMQKVLPKVQALGKQLCERLSAEGMNLITNVHSAGEQSIPYTHFHLLPRYAEEESIFNKHKKKEEVSFEELAKKVGPLSL